MRAAAALALLALAGCIAARPPERRVDPMVARVIAMAADQVRRCYHAPRVGRNARDIVTVLDVTYAPDGTLAALPVLVAQHGMTPDTAVAARALAEAAALAVARCAPVRLPPEQYRGGWNEIRLTFSPKAVA